MALTQQRLLSLISYDPETGLFHRLWKSSHKRIGTKTTRGYLAVGVDRRRYLLHRLAWLAHYGEWPAGEIDHINGNRSDNRIANLRTCTRTENLRNRHRPRSDSQSGIVGVGWSHQAGKWWAYIDTGTGKRTHLGLFVDKDEAARVRRAAELRYFGDFAPTYREAA